MRKKCKHRTPSFRSKKLGPDLWVTERVCLTCCERLPLGASNDDSEALEIELKALRLAASETLQELIELDDVGCLVHHDYEPCDGCQSWHLARVIASHSKREKPFGCSSDCRAPGCGGGCSQ